jgi:hypothetical protein
MTDATADAAGEESLGDSYINLLDEPSFVDGPDISLRASLGTIGEDDDVGASQKGEKDILETAASDGEPGIDEEEEDVVVEECHLKPSLFSLDVFVHNLEFHRPKTFPASTGAQVVFKFMDFPPVRVVHPAAMSTATAPTAAKNGRPNKAQKETLALNSGKSCLFRSSFADLRARCNAVPLYLLFLLDNETDGETVDHLIGSAAINLSTYVESIEIAGFYRDVPMSNDGYVTGSYQLYNLIGRESATVKVSLRVKNFGVHMLSHFMRLHASSAGKLPVLRQSSSSSAAPSPSRPVHIAPPAAVTSATVSVRSSAELDEGQTTIDTSVGSSMDSIETFGVEDDSLSTNPTSEQWALGQEESIAGLDSPRETDVDRALRLMRPHVMEVGNSFNAVDDEDCAPTSHHKHNLPFEDMLPPAMVYTHVTGIDSEPDEEEPPHIPRGRTAPPGIDSEPDEEEPPHIPRGRTAPPTREALERLRVDEDAEEPTTIPHGSPRRKMAIVKSPARPALARSPHQRRSAPSSKSPMPPSSARPAATGLSPSPRSRRKSSPEKGALSAAERQKRERRLRSLWSAGGPST